MFVGDTGELDGQAGELMCYKYPHLMECVLLHVVGTSDVPSSYEVNGVPVRFFRTYAGAASICYDLALLERDAVDRVCDRASMESSVYSDSRRTDIERDVERWRRKT